MNRAVRKLFPFAVLACFLSLALAPLGSSQTLTGRTSVDIDYELYGVGALEGGGHLTWTLYDEQSSHLRAKIVNLFDNYTQVPPGFVCEGLSLTGNRDSMIDSTEAKKFTDVLEHYMEGSCSNYVGTPDRFMKIEKTDIVEKQLPVERSTENLVGSTALTATRLQIRFIFNTRSMVDNTRFNLEESSIPDSLHKVFEFDQPSYFYWNAAPPTWTMSSFLVENGWHVAWIGTTPVYTPSYPVAPALGNSTEGYWGFTDSTSNSTRVQPRFSTPSLRGSSFSRNWTDLRFADNAYVTVEYTGSRADSGDLLKLQASTNEPMFDNWVDVPDENGSTYFENTPWPSWRTVRFPLNDFLGQVVRLQLNFTSDGNTTQAPGFFVRNFRITGESGYHGQVEYNVVAYVVSTTSFSDFVMDKGAANTIRTPAGDILFFAIGYNSETTLPADSIHYRSFDFFENPQILFGLVVVAAYLTAYYQNRYYSQFKAAHPQRYRSAASRIRWLHWIGRIIIILLIVFYFFPGLFVFAAPGFLIGGPAMWFLGFFFVIGIALLSKFIYMRQARFIPPDTLDEGGRPRGVVEIPPPPGEKSGAPQFCADCLNVIESSSNIYTCDCGKVYHQMCAYELSECPECHRKIALKLQKERMVTVACPTCREVQHVKDGADLSKTKCTNCGVVLLALTEGLNYLVIDKDPSTSYSWFKGLVKRETPSLCLTTSFPEKAKKEHGLEEVEMYWLSDTNPGPKTLDPKRLEFEIIRAISNFVKKHKGAAVLLDGLEYLVVENGFDKTFKFVKRVNDLCSVHNSTFLVPISPGALGSDDLTMLKQEFDRIEELITPPPAPSKKGK